MGKAFVVCLGASNEWLGQEPELGRRRKEVGGKEIAHRHGNRDRFPVPHHVATRGLVVGPEPFRFQVQVVDQAFQEGTRAERVGPGFDEAAVNGVAADHPAGATRGLQDLHVDVLLVETVGSGQAGDAGPDDTNAGHRQRRKFEDRRRRDGETRTPRWRYHIR